MNTTSGRISRRRMLQSSGATLAARMAASQRPATDLALNEKANAAAWKTLPSWFVFGELDENIPAALCRFMAERAKARETFEIKGASHALIVSTPTRWPRSSCGRPGTPPGNQGRIDAIHSGKQGKVNYENRSNWRHRAYRLEARTEADRARPRGTSRVPKLGR